MKRFQAAVILSLGISAGLSQIAFAVGPYFENERKPGDRLAGPTPDLPPRAAPPQKPKVTRVIKGELLKIEQFVYLVRDDIAGNQVEVRIDGNTRMDEVPKIGDKIQVELLESGNAWSIKRAE